MCNTNFYKLYKNKYEHGIEGAKLNPKIEVASPIRQIVDTLVIILF